MKSISADNIFSLLTRGGMAKSVNVEIAAYDYFRSVIDKCFEIRIKKFEKNSFVVSRWLVEADNEPFSHSNNNVNTKIFSLPYLQKNCDSSFLVRSPYAFVFIQ